MTVIQDKHEVMILSLNEKKWAELTFCAVWVDRHFKTQNQTNIVLRIYRKQSSRNNLIANWFFAWQVKPKKKTVQNFNTIFPNHFVT